MDLRRIFQGVLATTLAGCGGAIVVPGDGGVAEDGNVTPYPPGTKCTSQKPSSSQPCGWSVTLSGDCASLFDGGLVPATCAELCGFNQTTCYAGWNGPDTLRCGNACEGRRPHGLRERQTHASSAPGEWFARAAWLEAASIDAFRILQGELEHHGAPSELTSEALASAEDEIAHARIMRSLAHRFGATTEEPRVERGPIRDLEAIALENAIEGCVRETYGALQNAWQAERATSARVRAAMRVIARDELKHASFAWKIAAWIEPKLDADARARVQEARKDAAARLAASIAVDDSLVDVCGLPSTSDAAELVAGLRRALWS
jgi:hypothetical protein